MRSRRSLYDYVEIKGYKQASFLLHPTPALLAARTRAMVRRSVQNAAHESGGSRMLLESACPTNALADQIGQFKHRMCRSGRDLQGSCRDVLLAEVLESGEMMVAIIPRPVSLPGSVFRFCCLSLALCSSTRARLHPRTHSS